MGIFDQSSRSVFVRSDADVGQEGLAHSLHSNLGGVLLGAVMLEQEVAIPKLFPQS